MGGGPGGQDCEAGGVEKVTQEMEDWLAANRDEISARIQEGWAAAERGELFAANSLLSSR